MRDAALRHGVEIFEHTPGDPREHGRPRRWSRRLQGQVRAPRVVLATHYGLAEVPELRRCAFVVSSDVLATVPIPDRLEALGLRDGVSISDSRLLPIYYRTTTDGRLVFGKSSGILAFGGRLTRSQMGPVSHRRRDILAGAMTRLYPALGDATIANVWTGPADRSSNGLPFFGRLRAAPNISFGAGYSGNGVAPSNLGGRVLASLVLDRDDEYAAVATRCIRRRRCHRSRSASSAAGVCGTASRARSARRTRAARPTRSRGWRRASCRRRSCPSARKASSRSG